jgi:hypothetical protein
MNQRSGDHRAASRLVWFLGGVLVLLAALEGFERSHSALFAATTHRGLTKVAMFDRHPRVNVLFLGSSRTQDGVSPDLASRALHEIAPALGDVSGFNAAFTGSSLGALVSLVPRFDGRSDLRVAVIELSEPQIFNEAAPWDEPTRVLVTLEDRLADAIQHVAIVRYRKALIGANLGRLPSLLAAPSMSGWETKGTEQFASWMGRREARATGFDLTRWRPEVFPATTGAVRVNDDERAVANQLAALAAHFRTRGVTPIFAVPPLSASEREAPERNALRSLFAEVARRGQCEVWNFATVDVPDAFFRDVSHLNREGRAQYSEALAHELARVLKAGGPAPGQR